MQNERIENDKEEFLKTIEKIEIKNIKYIDFVKNIKYAIAIENNNFMLVDRENKMIIILFPEKTDNYITFINNDFEFINYIKKLNNNNIIICFEDKFIIIKINYEVKSYNIIGKYKINLSIPTLSEFYNKNKFLLIDKNQIIIFQYEIKNNYYFIVKETNIFNNNNYDYFPIRYSYHPKNNNKEFIIIEEKLITYFNSITYQIKEKYICENNYLLENETNLIEWKDNILFICQFNKIILLNTNIHKIIFEIINPIITSQYYFKTIQLLKNNTIIMGIFINSNDKMNSNVFIISLNNLEKEFFRNKILYKKELSFKGTLYQMLNIVLSEDKNYFLLINGMSRFEEPKVLILKIDY